MAVSVFFSLSNFVEIFEKFATRGDYIRNSYIRRKFSRRLQCDSFCSKLKMLCC